MAHRKLQYVVATIAWLTGILLGLSIEAPLWLKVTGSICLSGGFIAIAVFAIKTAPARDVTTAPIVLALPVFGMGIWMLHNEGSFTAKDVLGLAFGCIALLAGFWALSRRLRWNEQTFFMAVRVSSGPGIILSRDRNGA